MRYLIHLSYDGTRYSGWQRQGNSDRTIAGKLENIMTRMNGGEVTVHGAGCMPWTRPHRSTLSNPLILLM